MAATSSARARPAGLPHGQLADPAGYLPATSTDVLMIVAEFLSLNRMKLPDFFRVFNCKNDGFLSEREVKDMLRCCNPSLNLRQMRRAMKQVKDELDKSMDGRISISLQDLRLALQALQEDIGACPPWWQGQARAAVKQVPHKQQQQQQQQQQPLQEQASSSTKYPHISHTMHFSQRDLGQGGKSSGTYPSSLAPYIQHGFRQNGGAPASSPGSTLDQHRGASSPHTSTQTLRVKYPVIIGGAVEYLPVMRHERLPDHYPFISVKYQ